MKVILDFPNLRDDPSLQKHLQAMMDMAKDAKGFLFFIDRGNATGMQTYMLNDIALAKMIVTIESQQPGVKQVRMMAEMMKRFRGGG